MCWAELRTKKQREREWQLVINERKENKASVKKVQQKTERINEWTQYGN
jgi:hypothetical protein